MEQSVRDLRVDGGARDDGFAAQRASKASMVIALRAAQRAAQWRNTPLRRGWRFATGAVVGAARRARALSATGQVDLAQVELS